jgi:glycosyltransferase involved in cell wall biosynthesis
MKKLAVLVPTYGRRNRLESIAINIHNKTKASHKIYFICENEDQDSIKEIERLKEECIVVSTGTYVAAINAGYRSTTEPFIMLGSDDIEFTDGWDTEMLGEMKDEHIGVVGHKDDWAISQTKKHGSHLLIRREYIEKHSGVLDEHNVVYCSKYQHIMCDIETEQTAMKRGAFAFADNAIIHHHHWFNKQSDYDETYKRATVVQSHDMKVYYERRKMFEQWYFESLFTGRCIHVNQKKLSIVIASYNELYFLKQTIQSLKDNTYHDYELIIVDDNSQPETKQWIVDFNEPCIKVFNRDNKYVNDVWNTGMKIATGDYICVINNDITFSKDWDIYLMDAMENDDVWMANPYQTDEGYKTPEGKFISYGRHERSGNIAIRGVCWMIKREALDVIGYIPQDLLLWFGDYWLAWQICDIHKKQSVFVAESIVHHFGSKSSIAMMNEIAIQKLSKKLFQQILRGDAFAFSRMTGLNVDKWLKIIYANLELDWQPYDGHKSNR